jgi:hypothetical protein
MNTTYQDILNMLAGCTSQNPMNFGDLLNKSGLSLATLTIAIDKMANQLPALIGRCELTKMGVKQVLLWPTGVVNKANWGDFAVNPAKRPVLAPPRRSENIKPKESLMTEEIKPVVATEPVATVVSETDKPKALKMLEYIQKNPYCNGAMLRKAADAGTVDSYIDGYIKRGEVIKETRGPRDSRYCLAKGLTAEMIYTPPHGKRGQHNKNAPETGVATSQSESTAKPAVQQISPEAQAEVLSLGGRDQQDAQGSAITSESTAQPSLPEVIDHQYGPFRVAYTSDGCLLIYGISFQPIELSKPQAQELFDFVGPQLNLVPQ